MFNYAVLDNDTTNHTILSSWNKFLLTFSSTKILAYVVLTFVVLLNLFVNLRVIYKVCAGLHGQRMRHVSSHLLIVQVSVISIGITTVVTYEALAQLDLLHYQIRLSCGGMDFIRSKFAKHKYLYEGLF